MTRRTISFVVLALVLAGIFSRLGVWQLRRLAERQASNRVLSSRLSQPVADVRDVFGDTAPRFRRVRVAGAYDYAREVILAARSNNGSPGVNLLTPVRIAGTDTAVLVNRGWVYSPDGATIDEGRWRERDTTAVEGYVEALAPAGGRVSSPRGSRIVHRLVQDSLAPLFPYPVAGVYVVAFGDSATSAAAARDSAPVRLTPPSLDEGPHRSYAIQWFCFALIAIVGAGIVVARDRRGAPR
jgi:surfeit locus 1 family protein